jgi:hypothetical protein
VSDRVRWRLGRFVGFVFVVSTVIGAAPITASVIQAQTTALPAASQTAHDLYAGHAISCEVCHPCGARIDGGHDIAWMDAAGDGFHAAAANGGLAACSTCHGIALDGNGGRIKLGCAECHGTAWKTG